MIINIILKVYCVIALIAGSVYWYFLNTPKIFIIFYGGAVVIRAIEKYKEKDKDEAFLYLVCSIVIIIFGIGSLINK